MTKEELSQLSPKEKRTKIAEACGWTGIHEEVHPAITYLWGYDSEFEHPKNRDIIPNYLNDLNAMHEAEKVLLEDQFEQYETNLCEITSPNTIYPYEFPARGYISATATQRADAFLLTLP